MSRHRLIIRTPGHLSNIFCPNDHSRTLESVKFLFMIDFLYGVALIVSSYAFPSSEKMTSSVARFGEEETIQLIQLLTSYLGQSLVLNV